MGRGWIEGGWRIWDPQLPRALVLNCLVKPWSGGGSAGTWESCLHQCGPKLPHVTVNGVGHV